MENNIEAKKQILNRDIQSFYSNKENLDFYKKCTDKENKAIKEMMCELDLSEFITDNGLIAKISVQNREKFNEPKLIEKLKELDVLDAIKTIEIVDMEQLEDLIYNGKLDAKDIADCLERTEVQTLKVKPQKKASVGKE